MKLQTMNARQFFISLPNQIVRAKDWHKGDDLKVTINKDGDLVITKRNNPAPSTEVQS